MWSDKLFLGELGIRLSDYQVSLFSFLNTKDCYSLFFRSIVELGPAALLLYLSLLWYTYSSLSRSLTFGPIRDGQSASDLHNNIALLMFFLTLLFGSLIKQASLYSSITFPSIVLLPLLAHRLRSLNVC